MLSLLLISLPSLWPSAAFAQTAAKPEAPSPAPAAPGLLGLIQPETLAERLATIALILLLCYVAYRILLGGLRRAMRRAEEKSRTLPGTARQRQLRAVTVMSLAASVLQWAISLLALIWVVGTLGVNLLPLLTGVGFLGAAVAFGAQSLVRDIVTGFFILLEGQYAVGDYVDLNGKFGQVQSVGLRITVLRDVRNQLHHIPNGVIATCTVFERSSVSQLLLVPLADPQHAAQACGLIHEMAVATQRDLPQHLLHVGTPTCSESAPGFCTVTLPFATFPGQDWLPTTELPNRARATLAAHEIAIPEGLAPQSVTDLSQTSLTPSGDPLPGIEAQAGGAG